MTAVEKWIVCWSHFLARKFSQQLAQNPILRHFGAWVLVGAVLGWLLAPDIRVSCVIAFLISGSLCGSILSFLTYPLSWHYSLTLVGAIAGLGLAPIFAAFYPNAEMADQANQFCLIFGALIGGSSRVWQLPITMVKLIRNLFP